MKIKLTLVFLTLIQLRTYSQDTYTSRKGSKFFPGHLDIVITVDDKNLRYELFNHWYSLSYAELRQLTIPLDSLNEFNLKNDSIKIILLKGKVKLVDKKYHLSRKIKHRKLCASASTMRKISLACKLSSGQKDMRHFDLYAPQDLNLDEEKFKKKVIEKLIEKTREGTDNTLHPIGVFGQNYSLRKLSGRWLTADAQRLFVDRYSDNESIKKVQTVIDSLFYEE